MRQIRTIQRRQNSLVAQHALFLVATILTLAGCIAVAVALRAQSASFGVTFWCLVGAVCFALVHAVRRLRADWLSLEQTARMVDRRAKLDDRLATALATAPDEAGSRLEPLLLAQLTDAAPRWHVQALFKRRVPRSLYAWLTAVAALLATSFYARPPTPPERSASAPQDHPAAATEELLASASQEGDDVGESALALRPESPSRADPGEDGSAGSGNSSAHGGRRGLAGESTSGHDARPDGSEAAEGADAGTALHERMQEAIRDALGAPQPGGQSGEATGMGAAQDRETARPDTHQNPTTQRADSAVDAMPPGRPAESPPGAQESGTSSGASAGAGGGGPSDHVLGNQLAEQQAPLGTHSLSIQLGALTATSPTAREPQNQPPRSGVASLAAPAQHGPLPPTADEHLPLAALRKPEVGAEHESIVRRIFTRQE